MSTITSLREEVIGALAGLPNGYQLRVGGADYDANGATINEPDRGVGYVVLWPGAGRGYGRRLGAVSGDLAWGWMTVCVGWTVEQCESVAQATSDRLVGLRLSGKSTNPITNSEIGATMICDDKTPGGPRWSLTHRFNLNTSRS